MNKKSKSQPFVNIGSSSLLIIFLILCLVTFAVLSLSGAKSDYSYSQKVADRKTAYYTANNTAEEILDDIDDELCSGADKTECESFFKGYDKDGIVLDIEGSTISYLVPMTDSQSLEVLVSVDYSGESGYYYDVDEWKVITTTEWDGDDTMDLIKID